MAATAPLLTAEAPSPQLIDRDEHPPPPGDPEDPTWRRQREAQLREMGVARESRLHRSPKFLVDQMVSGSGLFPPRLLGSAWFSSAEAESLRQLEALVGDANLARDLLAPVLYGVDVRIVLDDSGSMALDMLGEEVFTSSQQSWIEGRRNTFNVKPEVTLERQWSREASECCLVPCFWPCWGGCFPMCLCGESTVAEAPYQLGSVADGFELLYAASAPPQTRLFGRSALCCCCAPQPPYRPPPTAGLDPRCRRWLHAERHVTAWLAVYRAIGLEPPLYLLNRDRQAPPYTNGRQDAAAAQRAVESSLVRGCRIDGATPGLLFRGGLKPSGSTPLPEAVARALADHAQERRGTCVYAAHSTLGRGSDLWSRRSSQICCSRVRFAPHAGSDRCFCSC